LFEVDYTANKTAIFLQKGAEMGRFKLGSTVVAVFGPGMLQLNSELAAGSAVNMGQVIGAGRQTV
jgi:phosphatidylserine decarboxylase